MSRTWPTSDPALAPNENATPSTANNTRLNIPGWAERRTSCAHGSMNGEARDCVFRIAYCEVENHSPPANNALRNTRYAVLRSVCSMFLDHVDDLVNGGGLRDTRMVTNNAIMRRDRAALYRGREEND